MERHFTATVYVIHKNQVLLHLHAKLGKWLPPGGHVEPNETPPEAARREVLEETGLEIDFLTQENLCVDAPHAKSFERPFLCLLENIPPHRDTPAHQHMDLIYLATPKESSLNQLTGDFRWFNAEEIQEIQHELLSDVKQVIELIYQRS
jgi:8-oxo-dGTP pyrophosphatase MutT (NUDIX family)